MTERETILRDTRAEASRQRLCAIQRYYGVTFPQYEEWRPCPAKRGVVNGLPHLAGTLIATNGILALVHPFTAKRELILCHLQWFVEDKPAKQERKGASSAKRMQQLTERYGI